jgi:hypothetical protein
MITLKQLLENNKEKTLNKTKQSEAYDKMQKWHDGTRKQNVGALSDVKLKFNYKVCKELGFEKEMELLQKEAQKRLLHFIQNTWTRRLWCGIHQNRSCLYMFQTLSVQPLLLREVVGSVRKN